jgi:hypothetical protein
MVWCSKSTRWLPLVARVEWRAERRGLERPAALMIGTERRLLEIERSWHEGPRDAGGPVVTFFEVRDSEGRRLRISRSSDGATLVEVASSPDDRR